MSSTPFNLGIPVVDSVPPEGGKYVLRAKDEADLSLKIQALQNALSKNDLIRIYFIGYRPDRPIPVNRFFAEINVYLMMVIHHILTNSVKILVLSPQNTMKQCVWPSLLWRYLKMW